MCGVHIALQKLQAVAPMLYQMAFHSTGKVVALHLDNSIGKAYLCNKVVCPFLSRLACCILNQADKYVITLIPAYIPTHLNVGANFLSGGKLVPEWHLLPHISWGAL